MAHILSFSAEGPRRTRAEADTNASGELVAMKHVDLQTVVETVRFLRDIGRGHLLDDFNREPTPAKASH